MANLIIRYIEFISDCVECNDTYIGDCNQHSTQYTHIQDSVIESRARASLPKCLCLMDVNRPHKSSSAGITATGNLHFNAEIIFFKTTMLCK